MENYQFIKQIGHGSYGEVWLVKCSKTRKKHVLKRMDLHQAPKREQRAAHLEAKLLSTVKHPNIVTYLDSFHNSSGSLFIVMSYCECGDLYSFIKEQNGVYFEEKLIVHWFAQICLALKYLHDKHILHRNLKTRNIFLTKNQVIKVGDLGISKVLSTTQEMSAARIETPFYISPENFSGTPLSQKSDIWALGCCTYEMALLRHPYIAQDPHSLLQKIRRKLPPIPEMYSSELFDIIMAMLNHNPEKRPCVTKLLLNDYVRRYILLILQDNSKSPDGQYSENTSELSSARSKSSSELTPRLSNNDSSGVLERSRSTCPLPNNNLKKPKLSGASLKTKLNQSKTAVISVPDVNGNGDGNDNSQHRLRNLGKNSLSPRTDLRKDTYSLDGSNKCSAKSDSESKISCNPTLNLKSFETRIKARQQKQKGEISLQILNNLTQTLHTTRSDKFVDNSNISPFDHVVPKSPADAVTEKQSVAHTKRLASGSLDVVPKGKLQNNVCALPQIK